MNAQEITSKYTETSIRASKLQNLFLATKETLGSDHEATKMLWNEYVEACEIAQPWSVKMGQLMMQQQIDQRDPAEHAADANFNS